MPTEVCAGAVVAGNGPPWCMPWVTATPVGKPSKISRPLRSLSAAASSATSSASCACAWTEPVSWPSMRTSASSSSSREP